MLKAWNLTKRGDLLWKSLPILSHSFSAFYLIFVYNLIGRKIVCITEAYDEPIEYLPFVFVPVVGNVVEFSLHVPMLTFGNLAWILS